MNSLSVDEHLDACGLLCPEPVMMLHGHMRALPAGGLLEVRATDPSTQRDIPKFCEFLGHALVEERIEAEIFIYLIRKKAD